MVHQLPHGQLPGHVEGLVSKTHADSESLLGLPGETSACSGKSKFFPYPDSLTEKNHLEKTLESEYPQ